MDDLARYTLPGGDELIVRATDNDRLFATLNNATTPLATVEAVAEVAMRSGSALLAACAQTRDDFGIPRGWNRL